MDKHDMTSLSNLLYAELLIGAIVLKFPTEVTIADIQETSFGRKFSDKYIFKLMQDLIAYGIVSPKIRAESTLLFSITEFGVYYFDALSKENPDIEQLLAKIGSKLA